MSVSTTIRIEDTETLNQIDALAKTMERSRNWVINRAIKDYVQLQAWQIEKIKEGLVAAEMGDFASEADLQRVLAKHVSD